MRDLAVFGASGHGKVVADMAECLGWRVSFFDDGIEAGTLTSVWPVLGGTEALLASMTRFDGVVVAIGNNRVRLEKLRVIEDAGGTLVSLIHPGASVSRHANLGAGTVVMAGAVINVDASLGKGCIVNTGATIDHDCILGDGVHVSPGANVAGTVNIGTGSWVGIGAAVRQLINIGKFCSIGAGAVVIGDVPDGLTVAGVPAAEIR